MGTVCTEHGYIWQMPFIGRKCRNNGNLEKDCGEILSEWTTDRWGNQTLGKSCTAFWNRNWTYQRQRNSGEIKPDHDAF